MASTKRLSGHVALVTGGSRGIGKGVALQLGGEGATVYITGRPPAKQEKLVQSMNLPSLEETAKEVTARGGKGIAVYCDHANPAEVQKLFEKIEKEQSGRLDILVNSAFSAHYEVCVATGKFWERDPSLFEQNNQVSLTNSYVCAVYAARLMVPRKKGLIITLSSVGGAYYIFTPAYGVGKIASNRAILNANVFGNAACDRLATDMAHELFDSNVASISIWPGCVKTEYMMMCCDRNPELKAIFGTAESREFLGKCVVAMAADPKIMEKTGHVVTTVGLGREYKLLDEDGSQPTDALIDAQQDHLKFYNATKVPKNKK